MRFKSSNRALLNTNLIIHIGPDPIHPGGIASVIDSSLKMTIRNSRILNFASWNPNSFYGLSMSFRVALQLIKLRIRPQNRVIVHVHFGNFGSYLREGSLLILSIALGFDSFATFHGQKMNYIKRLRPARYIFKLLTEKVDGIYFLNPNLKSLLIPYSSKAKVIVNPLPFRVEAEVSTKREKAILFAGVRDVRKGFDILLDAWNIIHKQFPEWTLYIAGPFGDFRFKITAEQTIDLGNLPRHEVIEILSKVAILCLPSRNEQSPMILWEALGKNTCVVATSVGAIPWILGPSYPYLAVPNDVLSLAELLSKAITADNKILIRNMNEKSRVADLENLSRMWEREYRVE